MTDVTARIHERGYRRYDGPRLGPEHAIRSLIIHTLQRVLGLKRPARSKILPVISVVMAYLPAAVFVGLAALLPDEIADEALPTFEGYYGFISAAVLLFVAFVAPESLCTDRRTRSLSLYLAAPLNRTTYLLAKGIAVGLALCLVTVGPPLLLIVGLSLQGHGPDGIAGLITDLLRIVGAGLSLAILFGAVSLGVSSLSERRAVASAASIFGILALGTLSSVLVFGLEAGNGFLLVDPTRAGYAVVARIHGHEPTPFEVDPGSTPLVVAAWFAWTLGSWGLAWIRYQRLQVTR